MIIQRKAKLLEFSVILSMGFLIVIAILSRTTLLSGDPVAFQSPDGDHHKFIYMASHDPFDFHIAPFCWRVLAPMLAKVLPFSLQHNFLLITILALSLTGTTMYYLARTFDSSRTLAVTCALAFYSLGWATQYNIASVFLSDSLAFLIVSLAIYAIRTQRILLLGALLTIGATAKESVLFVIPLFYTLSTTRCVDLALFRRTLVISAPAILVTISLRTLIPALNGDPAYVSTLPSLLQSAADVGKQYNALYLLQEIGLTRILNFGEGTAIRYTLGTFNIIFMLPFFALKKNYLLAIRFMPFLILVYMQLLFATNQERLLVLAFPAIILLSLNGISNIATTLSCDDRVLLLLPLIPLIVLLGTGYHSYLDLRRVPFLEVVGLVIFLGALISSRQPVVHRSH